MRERVPTDLPVWVLAALLLLAGVATAATVSHLTSVSNNDDGTVLNQPGGPTVTLTENTDVYNTSGDVDSSTIQWNTTDGNVTFSASGTASATIAASEINGSWTNVTAVDASNADLTINPDDKTPATVGGSVTALSIRDGSAVGIDDGTTDFVYSASGPGTVTLRNLPADTTFSAATTAGDPLGQYTTDSNGVATISVESASSTGVVLFTSQPPTIDDSTASPNETQITDRSVTLAVNVTDPDFPTGDEVTATFYVDGSQVGTDTITANGTVSETATVSTGGSHTWSVDIEDGYGRTDSGSWSFRAPSELTLYNESAPQTVLDNVTATVAVYTSEGSEAEIVERTTDNGTIDLAGLPADQPLVISADAPGYRPRRIFVTKLYDTQKIYLLPENESFTEVIFGIQDYSGNYPSDTTVLEVQRAINGSWQTVLGDYFGATGEFSAQLAYNERHRLVLRNTETGARQVLGTYTPLASSTEQVTVSPEGDIEPPKRPPSIDISPPTRRLVTTANTQLAVTLKNRSDTVESWSIGVYHINTTSGTNTTITERNYTSPSKTVNMDLNLSTYDAGVIKVITAWETTETSDSAVVRYTVVEPSASGNSLLDAISGFVNLVPSQNQDSFTGMLAVVLTIVGTAAVASRYPMPTELIGAVGIAFVTVFAVIGWLSYNVMFVTVVAWGAITVLRRGY